MKISQNTNNMEQINIYKRQFDNRAIELLSAQRNVYKIAKRINFVDFCISIIIPFIFSILVLFFNELDVGWIKLIIGAVTFLLSLKMGNICKNIKYNGALIQRAYDLYVVGLGEEITNYEKENIVNKYCDRFKHKKINAEYYQDYSNLSYPMQQANCLKENMRFDENIRKSYRTLTTVFLLILILIIIIIECVKNLRFREVCSQLYLCIPIFAYLFRNINTINQDIESKNVLKSNLMLLEKYLQNQNVKIDIDNMLRNAQNDLNEYRKYATLVPEIFYKIYNKVTITTQKSIAKRINNETRNTK